MDGGIYGTILGGVLGFGAAVLPELISFLHNRWGTKPTITPISLTAETTGTNGAVIGEADPDTAESGLGPEAAADYKIPYIILDFLRSSVRPVLTYGFFVFFVYVKLVSLNHALHVDHTKVIDLLPILWDEGTEALFAAVLSFWFGSRALARFRRK